MNFLKFQQVLISFVLLALLSVSSMASADDNTGGVFGEGSSDRNHIYFAKKGLEIVFDPELIAFEDLRKVLELWENITDARFENASAGNSWPRISSFNLRFRGGSPKMGRAIYQLDVRADGPDKKVIQQMAEQAVKKMAASISKKLDQLHERREKQAKLEYGRRLGRADYAFNSLETIGNDTDSEILEGKLAGMSSQAMQQEIQQLSQKARQLGIESVGRDVRIALTSQMIADLSDEIQGKLRRDPACQEIQKIIDVFEIGSKAYHDLHPEKTDINMLKDLITHRTTLAQRQLEVAEMAGQARLEQLTNQLRDMTIDKEQALAEQEYIQQQLQVLKKQYAVVVNSEAAVRVKMEVAEQAYREAQEKALASLLLLNNRTKPYVTIIE